MDHITIISIDDVDESELVVDPVEDLNQNIDMEKFKQALTSKQQDVLEKLEHGFSHVEIADMFGITRQAIEKHLKRIQRKFLEFLHENNR